MSYSDRHNPPDHIDPSRLRVGTEGAAKPAPADPLAVLEPVLRERYEDLMRFVGFQPAAAELLRLATENAELRRQLVDMAAASAEVIVAREARDAELLGIVRELAALPDRILPNPTRAVVIAHPKLRERARAAVAKLEGK